MISHILLFLFSVLVASVSQILLKQSANKTGQKGIYEYLNPRVIVAYILFFGSTLATTLAYRQVPLSFGPILECSSYVYILVLGHLFLKEKVRARSLIGVGVIILGIVVYSL